MTPLKNVLWIKLWLCLLDNPDFMECLDPGQKWYFIGMLLLYPKYKHRLKDDGQFLSKKLTQNGQDIAQDVDRIVKVMGLRRKNGFIYIPNFKKYNPYIWSSKGTPKGGIEELPVSYSYKSFKEVYNNKEYKDKLKSIYPKVNIELEFKKMDIWLKSNPNRRYKNYGRFATNWISRVAGKNGEGKGESKIRKIPPPKGGYQTGENLLE